jgi:multidrug efflux pump subunit AcrA (membrane-fusion protein)
MYAEVSLEMNRRPDALTVPAAAVGSDGDGNFVYTITDNREAQWTALIEEIRFARDSPLEGDGFELSVPRRERGVISILAKDKRKVYGNDERLPIW